MTGPPMIRFDNFKPQYAALREELDAAVHRVLDSGWFVLGPEVAAFEKEFADYIGCEFCVAVASGTDALTLSLAALDIGPGDEVITTDMTAFPTITAIMRAGAVPVTADIRAGDGLMDPRRISEKITPRTRAVVPVHLYGQACDMDAIAGVADAHGLAVVEDCAQSAGALYKGRKTGSIGAVNGFSFYPTKNLGAYGDAGAVTTHRRDLYDKLLQLRNYGQRVRYYHDSPGFNSRMDEMQAAVLRVKLRYLDDWNQQRRQHAAYYRRNLETVAPMDEHDYGTPVYHLFVVKTPQRDGLAEYLKAAGVQNLIHYPVPVHCQKAFPGGADPDAGDPCPNTSRFADEILSLPIYPELKGEERQRIVNLVNAFHGAKTTS